MTERETNNRVFVSSTFKDLGRIRAAIIRLLKDNNFDVLNAEDDFEPEVRTDARLWSVYQAAQSDAGVIILAGRRGTIAPGLKKSYTHLEIDALAATGGRAVLIDATTEALERLNWQDISEKERAAEQAGYRKMCRAADAFRNAGNKIVEGDPFRLVAAHGEAIVSQLHRELSQPAVPGAANAKLLYACSSLQSRLWRIVTANYRSFRGAYKSLLAANEALHHGACRSSPAKLMSPLQFVSSTLERIALYAELANGSVFARERTAPLLKGEIRLPSDHPLTALYGNVAIEALDWRQDIDQLVNDRQTGNPHLYPPSTIECAAGVASLVERYPVLASDLVGIVDTDLVSGHSGQPFTWNRLKLLSNALVDVVHELDPERRLVPERDRAPLRFRHSWAGRSLVAYPDAV